MTPIKPIYIVGGWMRSGTSMMIQALEAGGMVCDYTPGNPDYEMTSHVIHLDGKEEGNVLNRYPEEHAGHVIKNLRDGPALMTPWAGGYKLVYMRRSPEAQAASWEVRTGFYMLPELIEFEQQRYLELAQNRKDTEVLQLQFDHVISHPYDCMATVAEFFGVNLDIEAAASIVNPEKRHHVAKEEMKVPA